MEKKEINKHFDFIKSNIIDESMVQVLMAEGKIYCTRAKLYEWEASKIIDDNPTDPYSHYATYSGHIVADSWHEAEEIANKRGWGEVIDGVLRDIVPINKPNLYNTNNN